MPRKLASLLSSGSTLQRITARAGELARLQRQVHLLMEQELAGHCRVADVQAGTLVMEADGPAWATRLRYQGSALLAALHKNALLETVTQLRIRVRPAENAPVSRRRRAQLSSQGAKVLRGAAEVIDDPALSAALRRLASRAK